MSAYEPRLSVNLNKLFPRLTIRAKLAIAFVALASLPLLIVGAVGLRSALTELRTSARERLDYEMELAFTRTSRSLREMEQHVTYIVDVVGTEVIEGSDAEWNTAYRIARTYLVADSSSLFRIKVIDDMGEVRLAASVEGDADQALLGSAEPLYRWAASSLEPGSRTILPIELRSSGEPELVRPAIAVVAPVHSSDGESIGAVIGEASVEVLFSGLELAGPGLDDVVTGLATLEGNYLYHSEHKRDWTRLLVGGTSLSLATEFPDSIAERLRTDAGGLLRLEDGRDVAFRRVQTGPAESGALVFYRALPPSLLDARVWDFLFVFGGLGASLVGAVLVLSVVASGQITSPVYRLSAAARALSSGGSPPEVRVETNDELEDLARDFNEMSKVLSAHREHLEALVDERTAQLSRTEAHLGRIVTDAEDAILALGPDGDIRLWNRAATELFGWSADEVRGRQVAEVLGPSSEEDAGEARFMRRMMDEDRSIVNHRTRRRAKDGSWIPVSVTKSVLRQDGVVIGHSLVLRDDRARERVEEQMRRSERLAAISVMAGGIAHELNNPLSVLSNRIELMERDARAHGADARFLSDLDVLAKHVGRIGSITSDLLRFARDEADELSAVDVNEAVGRVFRLLQKVFTASDIELKTDLGDVPHVLANDTVVETVLVNLLLNAQQSTPPGGSVTIKTRGASSETAVEVEVSDTGPGVPPELQRRVFEPFFTTKAARGGTGLGLAVCRAMVDRLGGGIDLVSENGKGATFRITLPCDAKDVP